MSFWSWAWSHGTCSELEAISYLVVKYHSVIPAKSLVRKLLKEAKLRPVPDGKGCVVCVRRLCFVSKISTVSRVGSRKNVLRAVIVGHFGV